LAEVAAVAQRRRKVFKGRAYDHAFLFGPFNSYMPITDILPLLVAISNPGKIADMTCRSKPANYGGIPGFEEKRGPENGGMT
jgi:hypothetical protein